MASGERRRQLRGHDVVVLEPLHLLDLGDLDAGCEAEVLSLDPVQPGHVALHEPRVVELRDLGRGREQGDRSQGLRIDQITSALSGFSSETGCALNERGGSNGLIGS